MKRQITAAFLAIASIATGVAIGVHIPLHFRMFAKYILDPSGGTVTALPEHLHQQVSDICHEASGVQASSYGSFVSEELNYTLGDFRCERKGDTWHVWDIYKFDGIDFYEGFDDRKEGGPVAIWLTDKLGNFDFEIKVTIPVKPLTPLEERKQYGRRNYQF